LHMRAPEVLCGQHLNAGQTQGGQPARGPSAVHRQRFGVLNEQQISTLKIY